MKDEGGKSRSSFPITALWGSRPPATGVPSSLPHAIETIGREKSTSSREISPENHADVQKRLSGAGSGVLTPNTNRISRRIPAAPTPIFRPEGGGIQKPA